MQPRIHEGTVLLIIGDSRSLEFLWCSDAPGVGVPRDAGDGANEHGHTDDGNQGRVQGASQERL